MYYITGDTHGNFDRITYFQNKMQLSANDVLIILGDVGLNYYKNQKDVKRKELVNKYPFIIFCIHGNHEARPDTIESYKIKEFCGGVVWYEEDFPNILFAKDGEIYDFDGVKCIVIGGAYSVDKYYRIVNGWPWFFNEQPNKDIKKHVEDQLKRAKFKVDVVFSHTCPYNYEPREFFMKGIDQELIDKSTEYWLQEIESKLDYKKWYCGHFHVSKKIDKMQFMFEDYDVLKI